MIKAELMGDAAVVAKLRLLPGRVEAGVFSAVTRLSIKLQRKVREEKLGGGVLNVRTGRLRRSVNQVVMRDESGVVGIVSTNVKYARRHEYGFNGDESVRECLRMIKQAWGKQIKNPHQVTVRAHTRKANTPKRSFLRSSLHEMQDQVQKEIQEAVEKQIRGAL